MIKDSKYTTMNLYEKIYSCIKEALCKYISKPLTCTKEDIILLVKELEKLYINNNLDYNIWKSNIKFYTKINASCEIDNILLYTKNRI